MVGRRRAVLMTLVGVAGLAGCARSTRTGVASVNRNFCPKASATLYVTNDGWLDVVIYVTRGSTRYRLGEVTSIQSGVFQLPDVVANSSTFGVFVDPIGTFDSPSGIPNGFYTGDIPMQPGHTVVDLRVANIINQSSFSYGVELPEET